MKPSGVPSDLYKQGVNLFNQGKFFEAHEVLEDVWRTASGLEKQFLQGLIQVAVALHHHSTGNIVGARSLLLRAGHKLEGCPDHFQGIKLEELRRSMAAWSAALAAGESLPELPRIRSHAPDS